MRRIVRALTAIVMMLLCVGFKREEFSLSDLSKYEKEFKTEPMEVCSTSSTKTYEDYRCISNVESPHYKYIHEHCEVDQTGLLLDEDGFIATALGYSFGDIGARYYINLDTGITIPVVKVDAKAAADAPNGCSAGGDASVIEFVIDTPAAIEYFGSSNGLASNGNFNNNKYLNGNIVSIERVLDERVESGIVYVNYLEEIHKLWEYVDNFFVIVGGYRR